MYKSEDGTMIFGYRNGHMTESEIREAMPAYKKSYTYEDYLTWDDDIRWELIDGIPYIMAGPNVAHQTILGNLHGLLWIYLRGKPCKVYLTDLDVRLNADTLDDSVVRPDIIIVCDHSKIDEAGIKGAPDMAVEILSPSTAKYDKTTKYQRYLRAGVRELWIIDPEKKTVEVNILNEDKYITHFYMEKDTISVHVLEGCDISLSEVFEGV